MAGKSVKRRPVRRGSKALRISGAFILYIRDAIVDDARYIWVHARLFIGITLFIIGIFSWVSDVYCDGNTSNYYACTRPTTYYYYPWWAVLLILFGAIFITLWILRRKRR